MAEFVCEICSAPMKIAEKLQSKKGKRGNTYRVRRFKCTVCDFVKTVFASGERDDKYHPAIAQDEINLEYKRQEQANKQTNKK